MTGDDGLPQDELFDDPFCNSLDITFDEIEDGAATARMPVTESHLNFAGVLHGGAAFTLADAAAGAALSSRVGTDANIALEANVSFLEAVDAGETVIATAEIPHESRKTAELTVTVETEAGARVASYRCRGYKF
ncbi:PaaI family thioesterase [Haloterrigena sp. SYSU A121-1]|uniref:PaaI family thioesterase n=1 Tax=Haloterrigena gelatinilytica TaxID=2741724 RepID=A0A8J8GSP8_9EURY|nr:PaaI family thioesterase [Haloterrigena gelatinilytica]NUB93819.1 PaaI family thioesterase [Haloterrigena gelatinilytica]